MIEEEWEGKSWWGKDGMEITGEKNRGCKKERCEKSSVLNYAETFISQYIQRTSTVHDVFVQYAHQNIY